MIRGKDIRACPFGLPIPSGCQCAGKSIYKMGLSSTSSDSSQAAEMNKKILFESDQDQKCPFADIIYPDLSKVDCKFDATTMNKIPNGGSLGINPSPLYPHTFVGEMAKPLYSNSPDSSYKDDNIHNTYMGLLSFYG